MSNLISVSQFNNYVHNIFLAEELLQNIQIYGEVSEISFSGNNLYFCISDNGATLSCVKFGVKPVDTTIQVGDQIIVIGAPNYYIKGGKFSFNVHTIEAYGEGALYKQFLALKNKLQNLGMFDATNKKPIPENIKRIGVITSETGAVIHDIIDITKRRNPLIDIVIYPAKVQGINADETIISGIHAFEKTNVDVVIIARGGGSAEDLMAFNSEKLAYAIFEAKKVIISAVGHETDFSISDFVADVRAPTPSAAAELISINLQDKQQRLSELSVRFVNFIEDYYQAKLRDMSDYAYDLENLSKSLVLAKYMYFREQTNKLLNASNINLTTIQHNLDLLSEKMKLTDPRKIFDMGYSKVFYNSKQITTVKDIPDNADIEIMFIDGVINATVTQKGENE